MNINYKDYNKIELLVDNFYKKVNLELEARLCSNNKMKLNYYKFKNILCRLILSIENGGMGLNIIY